MFEKVLIATVLVVFVPVIIVLLLGIFKNAGSRPIIPGGDI